MPNLTMSTETKIALILLADAVKELAVASVLHIGMENASSVCGKAQAAINALNREVPASHPGSPLTNG